MGDKNLPILIVGFGSIGKRHYQNLKMLSFDNVSVFDNDPGAFGDTDVKRLSEFDINQANNFQIVFICSPSNFHFEQAMIAAKAGCHLFIEKPVSSKLDGLEDLDAICQKKNLITMVGCNMRFNPCLVFIKKYLQEKKLGNVYSFNHHFGYYLPFWRPGQDYSKNYAAKKERGGGIILDDIHEFDLLFWLNDFKPVVKNYLVFSKISDLTIETEDQAAAIFLFEDNILGIVSCNYLEKSYSRGCKIIGQNGVLEWDFKENKVCLLSEKDREVIFDGGELDINEMYLKELGYFLGCVGRGEGTFNDANRATFLLKYII